MSVALDAANKNLVELNVTIKKVIPLIQPSTGVPEADVQLLADGIAVANSTLAAVIPPAPPPPTV